MHSSVQEEFKKSDDRIYYNISLRAEEVNFGSGADLLPAEFSVERTIPILDNPKDYYLTISRFSVPALDIPLIIMPIVDNQANPNLTPFTVTLEYLGNTYQESVIYVPTAPNAAVPPNAIPTQHVDPDSYYYKVYTYNHFITMFNTAFTASFALLKAAFPAAPQVEAPYFIYNPETELVSLIAQYNYSLAGAVRIFVNSETLTYFEALNGLFYGRDLANGLDFEYFIRDRGGLSNAYYPNGIVIPAAGAFGTPTAPYYLSMEQEYRVVPSWSSFIDLVFTTGTLPIVSEWIQTNESPEGIPQTVELLTDFQPLLNKAGDERTIMEYFPQGPYRIINLNGTTPLRNFDFQVWWKDKHGRLYKVKIPFGQELSIKFLFLKKSTFTS